jgi:hypothetical protein
MTPSGFGWIERGGTPFVMSRRPTDPAALRMVMDSVLKAYIPAAGGTSSEVHRS